MSLMKDKLYDVKVTGLENIPQNGGYILAPNHNDRSDPAFLVSLIKRRIYFLAEKRALDRASKYSLFLRPFIRYTGQLGINSGTGESTKVLEKAKKILEKGYLFCLFPEGSTDGGKKILEGRTGVARLTLMSKRPVIPIGMRGTYGIMPRYNREWFSINKKVEIIIGKPISFEEYYGMENDRKILRNITNIVMKKIKDLYEIKA